MNIRNITEAHYEESIDLASFAFQTDFSAEERAVRRSQFRPEEKWGAFEDDKLLAQLTLLPLTIYINGRPIPMGGLAGVSTWPEYRRQGLVSKLLQHSLEVMRRDGQIISLLHPFEFGFYRRFGWEMFMEHRRYTIPSGLLPKRVQVPSTVERLAQPDTQMLSTVYEQYARRYNGMLSRNPQWWEERIYGRKKGQIAVYRSETGNPQGYIIYDVKESKMTVHELVCLNETARQSLWTFIANHDSMAKEVTTIAPLEDDLISTLDNPRIKHEIIPYFMARIVDFEAFAAHYLFTPSTEAVHELCIQVEDLHAPWNNGVFKLSVDKQGNGVVDRVSNPTAEQQANMLSCDIQTLTCMLMGYRRPERLMQLQRLRGSREAVRLLEKLIPQAQTFLYDFF
ncbi:GNAT family N-acetyltransferase [Paenibacillus sp. PR3]|uniref:GNAT family N-acetyltransferase n=1 Tax=Paenibacillus terricola TaxID=2763503 RepID=A0ABR8N3T8_9BACL|nr:GNAT family N-acetyltransferase [Paenibacillus terricola]MBD3922839.1 GNAT family N-acetyltransferase [Paenibacillus terricola]